MLLGREKWWMLCTNNEAVFSLFFSSFNHSSVNMLYYLHSSSDHRDLWFSWVTSFFLIANKMRPGHSDKGMAHRSRDTELEAQPLKWTSIFPVYFLFIVKYTYFLQIVSNPLSKGIRVKIMNKQEDPESNRQFSSDHRLNLPIIVVCLK